MIKLRKALERGHFNHGWLDTWHSFSFGEYLDPEHMGHASLRVINEDVIQPGGGFPTHPHRDMEIITYVLSGGLAHKDSMGNSSVIHAGEIQKMSAGTGITHSEYNASDSEPVHLLQIWLLPDRKGVTPGYQQVEMPRQGREGRLQLIASPDGEAGSISMAQNARLYAAVLRGGDQLGYSLAKGRKAYIQVATGKAEVNGISLEAGDGVAIEEESQLEIHGESESELLLFDLH